MDTSLREQIAAATDELEAARALVAQKEDELEQARIREDAAAKRIRDLMVELGVGGPVRPGGGGRPVSGADIMLRAIGPDGATAYEIEQATGLSKNYISATLVRLQQRGVVGKAKEKRPGADGRLRTVYVRVRPSVQQPSRPAVPSGLSTSDRN
jgi:hypothetical protein